MDVFVGNLPERAVLAELEQLFRPIDATVRVKLQEKAGKDGTVARYAVCSFGSERLGQKAIKKLNRQVYRGQLLELREFYHRTYANERRALDWRTRPWDGPERRGQERRVLGTKPPQDPFADMVEQEKAPAAPKTAPKEQEPQVKVTGYTQLARKW